ncbi:MAG: hypothetical protein WD294_14930 [Phycisphaeraceae bacterium]
MAKYTDQVETHITARNEAMGELRKAEAQMKDQAKREKQRQAEQEKMVRERVEVERQLRDSSLRAQGQHLEADLQQVRGQFSQRIAAARGANQNELAQRLEMLRNMREQEIRHASRTARDTANARRRGMLAQAGGGRGAIEMLAGGGMVAGVTVLAQRMTTVVERAGELTDEFKQGEVSAGAMAGELATAIPFIGDIAKLSRTVRDEWSGAAQEVRELERNAADAEKRVEARGKLLESISKDRFALELAQANDFDRERLQLEERLQDRLTAIRTAARASGDRKAASLARQAAEDAHRQRMGDIDRQEREAAEAKRQAAVQADRQRWEAVQGAEAEIEQLRLQQTGQAFEAELFAIRRAAQERIDAAREAGNEELAIRAQTLGRMREAEAVAHQDRKRQLEELRQQAEIQQTRARAFADQIGRAGSRGGQASLPGMDSNRFLTGARQETERADRAVQQREQKQIEIAEKQLRKLNEAVVGINATAEELRNAPIVRAEGL